MSSFTRLPASVAAASEGATLVDRYTQLPRRATRLRYAIPAGGPPAGIALIDTTLDPAVTAEAPGRPLLWHLLWTRDESRARVTVRAADASETWAIAPGDTVAVPAGGTLAATGGQLGVAITLPAADVALAAPTHGADSYLGYNRQTVAMEAAGIRLGRWKLTQPLALAERHVAPLVVIALAGSVVVSTGAVIDQLRCGEAARIDPAASPTVTPDGLAYLLTIEPAP